MVSIEDKRRRIPIEDMTREYLEYWMPRSTSISNMLTNIGWFKSTRVIEKLRHRAQNLGVTLEFEEYVRGPKLTDMGMFKVDSNYAHYPERVIDRGIKNGVFYNECDECVQGPIYNDKPLKFKIQRLNGIYNDLRPENVRLLCPNCYSQVKNGRN